MELVIKGLRNEAHAREFIKWYCGQGEQDADVWFEAQDKDTPYRDCNKPAQIIDGQLVMHVKYPTGKSRES